ncbi:type IX secretion system plug protein domain-containing protein [Aureitalea marina]|uniref:DUF5103 domain-containing protein n=1 Tax=Aureitalea marina TaxID=930804 RepID=A0A2S7KMC7_9FLAO|nr:type IX secretion system plug protein domain-containing protein [Aureitalea marina]PQB03723.1 DUF5103 domain-containing protein [Aureitalea marina]
MRKLLLLCGFSLIYSLSWGQAIEQAEPDYIKTIQFNGNTEQAQLPIIRLGESIRLTFDDIIGDESDYYYTITHHDFDWTASDLSKNEYLEGFDDVRIETYENSLLTLQMFSHYMLTIPNRETRRLTKSGNYMIHIYNYDRELIFSRKFMIVEQLAGVQVGIKRARDLNRIETSQVVQFTINSPTLLLVNPKQTVKTLVLQNSDHNTAITNLIPQYTLGNELVYRYDKEATFKGGNEFNSFDNKDVRAASNGVRRVDRNELYEHYLFTDVPRKEQVYTYNPDINGNFVINNINSQRNQNLEAEYVWVHFALQYYDDLDGKEIYLYGNFNNWNLSEENRLRYDSESGSYKTSVLMKQGFYNYKYVLLNPDGSIDPGGVSGNYWQTENQYTVLVYFRDLGARYDRIIGWGQANSTTINNN